MIKLLRWEWDDPDPIKKIVNAIKKNPTWHYYKISCGMKALNYGAVAPSQKYAVNFFSAKLNMSKRDASRHVVRIS